MLKIINAVLRLFKVQVIAVPHISKALLDSAREITAQAESMGGSGEYRRAQAMRAMLNRHPDASERACALAIELVLP